MLHACMPSDLSVLIRAWYDMVRLSIQTGQEKDAPRLQAR